MLLRQVSDRFVLIGDPAAPPVVSTDVSRWVTARARRTRRPPSAAGRGRADTPCRRLRLPADTVDLIRSFYEFHSTPGLSPGSGSSRRAVERCGRQGARPPPRGSAVGYTLPHRRAGRRSDCDEEMAEAGRRTWRAPATGKTTCLIDGSDTASGA